MSKLYDKFYKSSSMTAKAISLLPSFFVFNEWYRFLKKSQWLSREKLEQYQLKRLQSLLVHSYEHVPYYRKIFDERGLKPDDIQDFKDLEKLPVLTKDIVLKNLDDLRADNYSDDKFEYVTTGGSTGTMGLYYEKRISRAREWAFMKTLWDRVGYKFFDKNVVLRGYTINSSSNEYISKKSFFNRWLILSSFNITEESLPLYVKKIREFKPAYIQAFPSSLQILARYMAKKNEKPFDSVKAILCGSENLYPFLRKRFEDVFNTKIYSWYGHTEQAVLAGACEYSDKYHIFPEYGIVEVVDEKDDVIHNKNASGEAVVTGLNNYIMPIIRYKTGDIITLSGEKCECGRNYDLIEKVEGRVQDYFVLKNMSLVSLTSVLASVVKLEDFPSIERFQFIQNKPGSALLKIMGDKDKIVKESKNIIHGIKRVLSDQLDVEIEIVDHIPLTKRGKHRRLIQFIDLDNLNNG